jgi:hypothetical protein
MPRPSSLVIVAALLIGCAALGISQQAPAPAALAPNNVAKTRPQALIDALAEYPFGPVYTEDINATNSITYVGRKIAEDDDGIVPALPVQQIVALGQPVAIPLLISHLTDQRPSKARYHDQPVAVAYLALDMLLHVTDVNDERVVVPGCEQHGLGDCMQPDFYFSPDSGDPNKLADVQKAWTEEDQKQPIKLVTPAWWRSGNEPALKPMPPGASPKSRPQTAPQPQ